MGNPLVGYDSDVWVSASPSLVATNETCTDSGDHINYTASIHMFWDKTQTFIVQGSPNGTTGWAAMTDYTFVWAAGKLVFATARTPGINNYVRISTGSYFNVTQLDASTKWALSIKGGTAKTTPFQVAGGWEQETALIKSATGTIDTFRNENRVFLELISTNQLVIFQLFISKTNNWRWQFAGRITGIDPAADAQNMQSQKITFDSENDVILLLV